jgi:CRP-like cAMP-binding protein
MNEPGEAEARALAASHALLQALEPKTLAAVIHTGKIVRYRAKRTVIKEGDPPQSVYCLLSGSVRVHHRREDGTELLVKLLSAPALFGEIAALGQIPVMEFVTTLETCDVLRSPPSSFASWCGWSNASPWPWRENLARRLCQASSSQRALAFADTDRRLAALLLDYADLHGTPVESGLRLELALSQDAMANDLAVSRKAVTMSLARLKEEGLVDKEDARYIIKDRAALEARSARRNPV